MKQSFRKIRSQPTPAKCFFCQKGFKEISYKDTAILKRFISAQAKIAPPKKTGVCNKHQRQLSLAIKRARFLAMLPFTNR